MSTNRPPEAAGKKLDPRFAALSRMPRGRLIDLIASGERSPASGPRMRGLTLAAEDPEEDALLASSRRYLRAPAREPAPMSHGLRMRGGEILASVFVRSGCDRERLEEKGVTVLSHAADVATAEVPLELLAELEADPEIDFIELSRPVRPHLDETVPMLGAAAFHRAWPPITGAGTVIGVIDAGGIDFHHPDFLTGDGGGRRTRIAYLWDQRAELWDHCADAGTARGAPGGQAPAGRAPAPWGYGLEYTAADLNLDLRSKAPYSIVQCRPDTPRGAINHGTHMAGIAAGNGTASGGQYTGVAPEAEIIFVNTCPSGTRGLADLQSVCDAIAYILDRAEGKPCVINLSMGDNLGPHDGTSLAERFIDGAGRGPGRAVVVAAGNSNDQGLHAEFQVTEDGAALLELRVPPSTRDGEAIEIWYGGEDRLDIELSVPGAHGGGGMVRAGETRTFELSRGTVEVTSVLHDRRNGDNVIHLLLLPDERDSQLAEGVWRLALRRPPTPPRIGQDPAQRTATACHAWIDGNARYIRWVRPTTGSCTLTTPATARGAIVVANYMTRPPRGISATSGHGPTRDGRKKPDLSAPGTGIMAPLACATPGRRWALYASGCGTSQAAAHVSGLVALVFERFGAQLTVDQVLSHLLPAGDGAAGAGVWHPAAGWGLARAPAAPSASVALQARHDGRSDTREGTYRAPGSKESPREYSKPKVRRSS